MVGLKIRDIDKDVLMMFVLSYEYSMSFTNLLKLYMISKQYFWTFMEICSPMLKMGIRKASMIRKSVDKILPHLTGEGEKEELTAREECIKNLFLWFVEDSFSDGEGCLTIDQLEAIPDTPPVLIAFHLHTNAELVTLLGNQTVGSHLVHVPGKALGSTTHRVGIRFAVNLLLPPAFYLNHLVAFVSRRLRVNTRELSCSTVHIQEDR